MIAAGGLEDLGRLFLQLQLVHTHAQDLGVPGEPYPFVRLIDAQADGDFDTLYAHDLPVARVSLGSGDPAAAIDDLVERLR